jgi:hypothetical protein
MSEDRILEALDKIKTEMNAVAIEAREIATKVEERNDTAILWRMEVCKKFDKVFNWFENLPCREREERNKQESRTQTMLWTGSWICVGVLFTLIAVHLGIWK